MLNQNYALKNLSERGEFHEKGLFQVHLKLVEDIEIQ